MRTVTRVSELNQKPFAKVRNYNEIIAYLDGLTPIEYTEKCVVRMKELDALFGNISEKRDLVLVGGTNGKSTTIHFAAKLLKEEGFKVVTVYSSHFLTYNERAACDLQQISNKQFADILNEVINTVELNQIEATAFELVNIAGLLYADAEKADVVILEVGLGGRFDATVAFNPKIAAVTRVADSHTDILGADLDQMAFDMMEIGKAGSWIIAAEQSKIRLQKMKQLAESRGLKWAMPIRKLASLPYVFEQLYGRIASLGERIAQIYVEDIKQKFSPFLRGNLLATERGRRGRPTVEAKRHAELNPIKTLKDFWGEQFDLLRGRFELLEKEKPTILLDNANNLDAFANLFLGIRLLHYQRPLKGLALIIGLNKNVNPSETIKLMRYLLKKVAGYIFFVPLPGAEASHSPHDLANVAKDFNVKAKACADFNDAFEAAKKMVDDRHGVVAIAGSTQMITEYWKQRSIKKL